MQLVAATTPATVLKISDLYSIYTYLYLPIYVYIYTYTYIYTMYYLERHAAGRGNDSSYIADHFVTYTNIDRNVSSSSSIDK